MKIDEKMSCWISYSHWLNQVFILFLQLCWILLRLFLTLKATLTSEPFPLIWEPCQILSLWCNKWWEVNALINLSCNCKIIDLSSYSSWSCLAFLKGLYWSFYPNYYCLRFKFGNILWMCWSSFHINLLFVKITGLSIFFIWWVTPFL
jgi:hypothetical protein